MSVPQSFEDMAYSELIESVLTPEVKTQQVWHYTDAAGALGVVQSQQLWASAVPVLNDSAEIWHGLGLIEAAAHADNSPRGRLTQELLRDVRSKLESVDLQDSFMLSASLNGSSYPLFLEYGRYALGLNPAMPLRKVIDNDPPEVRSVVPGFETGWRHVLYGHEEKRRKIDELLGVLNHLYSKNNYSRPEGDEYLASIECIVRTAVYMKDELFKHEQEVRLYGRASLTDARVAFRTRGDLIVPYIQIEPYMLNQKRVALVPLMAINLGPGLVYPTVKTSLHALLTSRGYDQIRIEDRSGSHR